MPPPANIPDWFDESMPGGIRAWFQHLLQRMVGALLRWFVRWRPTFRVPVAGWIVVLGFDHVQEAFSRWRAFPVPHDSKTTALGWAPPFLLAMQDLDADYEQRHAMTRQFFAEEHLPQLRTEAAAAFARHLPNPSVPGTHQQDLMWDYTYEAFIDIARAYYGLPFLQNRDDAREFCLALFVLSGFFFGQARVDGAPANVQLAFDLAWGAIAADVDAARGGAPAQGVMARALAGGVNREELISALLGMTLGFIPTSGNAHGRVLDLLLRNEDALRTAQRFARALPPPGGGANPADGELLAALHESLRMHYILPGLWRVAREQTHLGEGLPHARRVQHGDVLLLSGMAAMYDPARFPDPCAFRSDRGYWSYLNYGHQMHYCVGWDMANLFLVEAFRPVLRDFAIRRVPGTRTGWRGAFPWRIDVELVA